MARVALVKLFTGLNLGVSQLSGDLRRAGHDTRIIYFKDFLVVPVEEASRFGILGTDSKYRVTSFLEKPEDPPSTLANMGVYLFNRELLDRALWEDRLNPDSSHDFGKNIIPNLVQSDARVFAFPYTGYWMDVGTYQSYWQSHMDMLAPTPKLKLYNRSWIIHTHLRRA